MGIEKLHSIRRNAISAVCPSADKSKPNSSPFTVCGSVEGNLLNSGRSQNIADKILLRV